MPYKEPTNYSLITYLWVFLMSFLGGTVNHFVKYQNGEKMSFKGWLIDVVISGFVGVITFFFCEYAGFPQILTAAIIGITSHQGTRGLMLVSKMLSKKVVIEVEGERK